MKEMNIDETIHKDEFITVLIDLYDFVDDDSCLLLETPTNPRYKERVNLTSFLADFLDSYRNKYSNKTLSYDQVSSELLDWMHVNNVVTN